MLTSWAMGAFPKPRREGFVQGISTASQVGDVTVTGNLDLLWLTIAPALMGFLGSNQRECSSPLSVDMPLARYIMGSSISQERLKNV